MFLCLDQLGDAGFFGIGLFEKKSAVKRPHRSQSRLPCGPPVTFLRRQQSQRRSGRQCVTQVLFARRQEDGASLTDEFGQGLPLAGIQPIGRHGAGKHDGGNRPQWSHMRRQLPCHGIHGNQWWHGLVDDHHVGGRWGGRSGGRVVVGVRLTAGKLQHPLTVVDNQHVVGGAVIGHTVIQQQLSTPQHLVARTQFSQTAIPLPHRTHGTESSGLSGRQIDFPEAHFVAAPVIHKHQFALDGAVGEIAEQKRNRHRRGHTGHALPPGQRINRQAGCVDVVIIRLRHDRPTEAGDDQHSSAQTKVHHHDDAPSSGGVR